VSTTELGKEHVYMQGKKSAEAEAEAEESHNVTFVRIQWLSIAPREKEFEVRK
jgi:hypothetical protein